MNFAPHEQRVIDEHQDLTKKLNNLRTFFDTPIFRGLAEAEQMRLRAQSDFMYGYQNMLSERICSFMRAHAKTEVPSVVADRLSETTAGD